MDRVTRTVLIVDGSPTMLYYHAILLKRLEYTVLTASSAEDAMKIMEAAAPSVVVTELSLPLMHGREFIRKMKTSDRARNVPVIVLTEEEDASAREECQALGCASFLLKPVEPAHLFRAIQSALETTPRANIRLNASLKAVVGDGSAEGGGERTEYTSTISEGGLYLRTLQPQEKNVLTPVRIFVKHRQINAKAVVLYSHAMEKGSFKEPGMGMKFIDISEEDRNYLRSFIREQLTSDIGVD